MVKAAANKLIEGFGINTDILGTNLFNLSILLGLIIFYGRKVLGQILGERQSKIAEALAEAENRKNIAANALAEEQKKLALAKQSDNLFCMDSYKSYSICDW